MSDVAGGSGDNTAAAANDNVQADATPPVEAAPPPEGAGAEQASETAEAESPPVEDAPPVDDNPEPASNEETTTPDMQDAPPIESSPETAETDNEVALGATAADDKQDPRRTTAANDNIEPAPDNTEGANENTEPDEPIEPSNDHEPNDPTEHVEPADAANDNTEPDEPVEPVEPSNDNNEPNDTTEPVEPANDNREAERIEQPDERATREQYPYLGEAREGQNPESARTQTPEFHSPPTFDNPEGLPEPQPADRGQFSGPVQPFEMEAGVTYYRVIGDEQYPAGSWWSESPPASMDELRGDSAVDSDWNGDHALVTYTPTEDVQGWRGTAASQPASEGGDQYLRGGGQQIWIPAGQHPGEYKIHRLDLK